MKHLKILFSLSLIILTSACSSTSDKAKNKRLIDLYSAAPTQIHTYTIDKVENDRSILASLKIELESLVSEVAVLKRELEFNKTPYLTDQQNKQIEFLLFRIINANDAFAEIISFYRNNKGEDSDTHSKGAIIGMYAAMSANYYGSYFCALFHDKDNLQEILNIPHPQYEIEKDSYDFIYKQVTSPDNIELIELSWYLFSKEINDPNSDLNQIKLENESYAELIAEMDLLHASTHIQIRYILNSNIHSLPNLENRLRHSQLAKLTKQAGESIGDGLYQTRGFVFKNVARIKSPDSQILHFSENQVELIKEQLQPGDIILTYSAGYMSNIFLPGNFKHGITYIGTPEQRRAVGLSDDLIRKNSVSRLQTELLIQRINTEKRNENYSADLIEAVAEGVVLSSLDEILETHINRLVVIRPKLSEEERIEQLLSLFKYVGARYDFRFDFQNDTYQCCTELIYRTLQGKGSIDFSLIRMKGRWILAADDILQYYLEKSPESFEFIILADKAAGKNNYNAQIQKSEEGLKALYELMEITVPKNN